jgi:purine-cytosine permease-like protein
MKLKDALGIIFIGIGVTVATVGYRLLGLHWYFAACVLIIVGMLLIWSASRDRKIREALDDIPGDWGDRHYISGAHATDDLDMPDGGHD